jgi:hypothetical protein
MSARQYVPRLGRFLQVDPVEGGGAKDYAYPHDPVNMSDLDGKFRRRVSRFARRAAPWVGAAALGVCVVASAGACLAAGAVVVGVSAAWQSGHRAGMVGLSRQTGAWAGTQW